MCQDIGKPLSILPDASLLEATRLMTERKFNRLMVKGRYSNMLGTITSTDTVVLLRTLTLTLTLTPTLTLTLTLDHTLTVTLGRSSPCSVAMPPPPERSTPQRIRSTACPPKARRRSTSCAASARTREGRRGRRQPEPQL